MPGCTVDGVVASNFVSPASAMLRLHSETSKLSFGAMAGLAPELHEGSVRLPPYATAWLYDDSRSADQFARRSM